MMQVDGVKSNSVVLTNLVRSYLSSQKVLRAWEVIHFMASKYQVHPTVPTIGFILSSSLKDAPEWDIWVNAQRGTTTVAAESGWEEGGNGESAVRKKLDRVRMLIEYVGKEFQIKPDSTTFNWLINKCLNTKKSQPALAWQLLELMKAHQLQPKSLTVLPLLNYYAKKLKAKVLPDQMHPPPEQHAGGEEENEDEDDDQEKKDHPKLESSYGGHESEEELLEGLQRALACFVALDEACKKFPPVLALLVEAYLVFGNTERSYALYNMYQSKPLQSTLQTSLSSCPNVSTGYARRGSSRLCPPTRSSLR